MGGPRSVPVARRSVERIGDRARLLSLLVLVALLVAACSSSSDGNQSHRRTASTVSTAPTTTSTVPHTASTAPATTKPATNTSASAGCGNSVRTGVKTLRMTIAGRQRMAIVHVPVKYRGTTPTALVLNLHGSQSTARQQEGFSGMNTTSDSDTFIVVYPQGDIPAKTGFEWNVPGVPLFGGAAVPAGAPNDVAFLEQLVTQLEATYCVNTKQVDATGFSGGARMASQLGCDASSVFAAVAPVSGLRLPTPCPSERPVPVVSFHGTADPVDPYNGNGQAYWTYGVPTAAAQWGAHNGCSTTPTTTNLSGGVVLTAYGSCSAGAAVDLYTIAGEGHEWPGGPSLRRSVTRDLGRQSDAINANDVMWSFFMDHPLNVLP